MRLEELKIKTERCVNMMKSFNVYKKRQRGGSVKSDVRRREGRETRGRGGSLIKASLGSRLYLQACSLNDSHLQLVRTSTRQRGGRVQGHEWGCVSGHMVRNG